MALIQLFKRTLTTVAVVAAGGIAFMNPGVVQAFYEDIYPSDPLKQQALHTCFLQDQKFNRLDSSERANCYRRTLLSLGEVPRSAPADQPQPNFVDLRRSAGMGSLPHDDIRRQQDEQNALRSLHH
jgi:hypothetical protein